MLAAAAAAAAAPATPHQPLSGHPAFPAAACVRGRLDSTAPAAAAMAATALWRRL